MPGDYLYHIETRQNFKIFLDLFHFIYFILCVRVFSCTCVCVPCACLVPREAMEDFRFPETEIQRFVNYHVLMGAKAGLRATSALHC